MPIDFNDAFPWHLSSWKLSTRLSFIDTGMFKTLTITYSDIAQDNFTPVLEWSLFDRPNYLFICSYNSVSLATIFK